MLHGFDSSSLEFRRLLPKLEAGGAEVYALDVLGSETLNPEPETDNCYQTPVFKQRDAVPGSQTLNPIPWTR